VACIERIAFINVGNRRQGFEAANF
jgi:hypothetical protein